MVQPILQCASGDIGLTRPSNNAEGLFIMNEDASSGKLTKLHTEEAIESVWDTTSTVLGKAGIALDWGSCWYMHIKNEARTVLLVTVNFVLYKHEYYKLEPTQNLLFATSKHSTKKEHIILVRMAVTEQYVGHKRHPGH